MSLEQQRLLPGEWRCLLSERETLPGRGRGCSCTEQDIATAAQSYKDIAGERERASQDIAVQCTINTEL